MRSRRLEDRLDGYALATLDKPLQDAVAEYTAVGRLYASGDQDTGEGQEEDAYSALKEAAQAHLERTS